MKSSVSSYMVFYKNTCKVGDANDESLRTVAFPSPTTIVVTADKVSIIVKLTANYCSILSSSK